MKTTSFFSRFTICALLCSSSFAQSPAPPLLPFQGRLNDANGTAVADGTRVVQFKIYDAPVGGLADRFLARFPRLLPWLIVGILAAAVLLLLLNKLLH